MQLFVGTRGYSYKEWKGSFYPEKLPQKDMLRYYAERFGAVEINGSFYRMPNEANLKAWAEEVPPEFQFAFKAPQAITHFKRLKDAEEATEKFCEATAALEMRRGPLLFGLHPNHQKDVARLQTFLRQFANGVRVAFEFRHASWFDDEVFGCLRDHGIALCTNDEDKSPWAELVHTTDWGYLRLRREAYTDKSLAAWIKNLKAQKWKEAYIFFKHEDTGTGPKLAARFLELARA